MQLPIVKLPAGMRAMPAGTVGVLVLYNRKNRARAVFVTVTVKLLLTSTGTTLLTVNQLAGARVGGLCKAYGVAGAAQERRPCWPAGLIPICTAAGCARWVPANNASTRSRFWILFFMFSFGQRSKLDRKSDV